MRYILFPLVALAVAEAQFAPEQCGLFLQLGFDFQNFENYDVYFRETSSMTLPQAGTYEGPDAIEEYVRFSSTYSPFQTVTFVDQAFELKQFDPATGACVFRFAVCRAYEMNAPALDVGLDVTAYYNLQFEIEGQYVSDVLVYLTTPFLDLFFSSLVNTVGVAEYVCEVMHSDACAATWALNAYADISECVAAYETLPDVDAMGYFDGKSKGCRVVHSFMADTNAKHCPHISYAPQEDVDGEVKCQQSAQLDPSLDEDDQAYFDAFLVARDISVDLGYKLYPIPCTSDADCFDGWRCDATASVGRLAPRDFGPGEPRLGRRRLAFGSHGTDDADGNCVFA